MSLEQSRVGKKHSWGEKQYGVMAGNTHPSAQESRLKFWLIYFMVATMKSHLFSLSFSFLMCQVWIVMLRELLQREVIQ